MTLSTPHLLAAVGAMRDKRVLIVGDLMLDHYVSGEVERISPEAPVPVVRVSSERHLLGGAGNVARNVAQLGGAPHLISVVGADTNGAFLATLLQQESIAMDLVRDTARATTVKTRIIAHNQQVVRVDHESDGPVSEATRDAILVAVDQRIDDFEVVLLSDYGKGLVTPAFMDALRARMQACPTRPKLLVDPKTRNFSLYRNAFILTPNAKEAVEGAGLYAGSGKSGALRSGEAIFQKLACDHLLITLGAQGMALFQSLDAIQHIPTVARKVFDVTGAGDTVIATLGLALAAGIDLLTASLLANFAAGIVVGQIGAACVSPDELAQAIDALPVPHITPWSLHEA
ncbi:MAG: D-glycero-beta-D-manno-heptose-7-phosphate kinase [Desulfovibrionaceae bacterium]